MKTNTPNPLVPQGSMPDKRGKSHVRIAVFTILAVHAVLLGALLLQGCKRTSTTDGMISNVETNYPPPPIDTSSGPPPLAAVPPADTAPTTQAPPPTIETQQFTQTSTASPVPPPLDVAPPAQAAATEHVVVSGDVYSTIARKYQTTVKALVEANPGVNPSRLKVGQKLVIPPPTAKSTSTVAGNGANTGETTYVVKSGDSLMKIARTHGTSVKALRSANRLKTDQIKVGQKLVIPGKNGAPESGVGGTSGSPQVLPVP